MRRLPHRTHRAGLVGVCLATVAVLMAACGSANMQPKRSLSAPRSQDIANQRFPTKPAPLAADRQIPWRLVRVDDRANRIYLAASTHDCVTPSYAVVTEHPDRVVVAVFGDQRSARSGEFCNTSRTALVGYVTAASGLQSRKVAHG